LSLHAVNATFPSNSQMKAAMKILGARWQWVLFVAETGDQTLVVPDCRGDLTMSGA
jgi:hypothetical protein